jgi:hypothetical protein
MQLPQSVKNILDKPMDRKDFLKHVGIASLVVMGGGTILKSLNGVSQTANTPKHSYGSSAYGGNKATN